MFNFIISFHLEYESRLWIKKQKIKNVEILAARFFTKNEHMTKSINNFTKNFTRIFQQIHHKLSFDV